MYVKGKDCICNTNGPIWASRLCSYLDEVYYEQPTHIQWYLPFTFKTRLTSTTATCVCYARLFPIETSFLLEIVYRWMNKRTEEICFEIVQGKQEVLMGDPEGLTWEEFERKVMRWARPIYGTSYAIGLWCNHY